VHAVLAAQCVICGVGVTDVVFGVCFAARVDGRVWSWRSFIGLACWGILAVGWFDDEAVKGVTVVVGTGEN
jgi:hypothetical protein